jgi:paraquat-inducible protein B
VKTKLSSFWVGAFLLGGVALVAIGLLSFRSLHLFSEPGRFVAYFSQSVQGLDVGSAVKLRGVRVGRVTTIQVHYEASTRSSRVAVVGELDQKVMTDEAGKVIRFTDRAALQQLIDEGLRARMDLVGITGLQFVELDFYDPRDYPAVQRNEASGIPVVPTVRSGMSELLSNFSKIAGNMSKMDFAGLSRELQSLLGTVNQQAREVDLKRLVLRVTAAADALESLTGSVEAKSAVTNLNRVALELRGLIAQVQAQVEPTQSEVIRTLRGFQTATEAVGQFLGPQSGLGQEAVRSLQQWTETAESVQRLVEFLERNPNALITGRKRPEKVP